MNRIRLALGALAVALGSSAQAAPADAKNAMLLIQGACTMSGARLDLKTTPEGRLQVIITLPNGQRRMVTLEHRDVDTFMDVATNVMAGSNMQTTACMDPYVGDVTNTLSQLPERPAAPPPPAPAPFTPPALPAPTVMPSPPPPPVAAPPRPALPPAGDLPVGVVNGTAPAAPVAAAAGNRLAVTVQRCRAPDRSQVICELKVHNRMGQDAKVSVESEETQLLGEDSSRTKLYSLRLGEHTLYKSGANREINFDLIADAAPVIQFHYYNVPEALLSIKRMEVRIGARVGTDGEKQTFIFANVPITGR